LFLRGLLVHFILMIISLLIMTGCEKNLDKALNGELFYRNAGKLKTASARFDSVTNYGGNFGYASISLTGKYRDVSAFSVVKFGKPQTSIITTLYKANLKFTVSNVWSEGLNEFELYATNSDWSDSMKIDPNKFLQALGAPLAVKSDTSNTYSTMTFPLDDTGMNYIKSWPTEGSFLLKNSPGGKAMMGVYTNYGLSPPQLELFSHSDDGEDTTYIKSIGGNYSFSPGPGEDLTSKRKGIISEGNNGGFIMHFSLPDSFARTNAVNACKLIMPIEKNIIPPQNNLAVSLYILSAPFSASDTTSTITLSRLDYTIKPGDIQMVVDFTSIINTLYKSLNYNYGVLLKPSNASTSPSEVIISPPDSIPIIYTTLPEVR
jgi:hypothetical protein